MLGLKFERHWGQLLTCLHHIRPVALPRLHILIVGASYVARMAVSDISEVLCKQVVHTDSLLHRVHQGCSGLNSQYQPEISRLISTYYEIERKLVKSFPEHPGSVDLVRVSQHKPLCTA